MGAPSKLAKGKHLFLWKAKPTELGDVAAIQEHVLLNELSGASVHDFNQQMAETALKSVLTSGANKERWGDVAQREMLDHYNRYLAAATILSGQVKGTTVLPMPTDGSEGAGVVSLVELDLSVAETKSKLSMMEGAVITWTKQIREVVLEVPEDHATVLGEDGAPAVEHLTPDCEVKFWETRAGHLNSIWAQLTGPRITKVLDFLGAEQSTYAVAFQKTMREVHANKEEANDNLKYLQTLSKWFSKLNEQDDFSGLPQLYKPIVHTILLIWKNSDHYNKPMRLVVLLRMICNSIINQTHKYVSGSDAIFGLLEDEEFARATETLKTALKVCGAFKSTFFDFRDMAQRECPSNPWAVAPAAIFVRLNSVMERCMDMMELCGTYSNFFKLDKMVEGTGMAGGLGGTKGGVLGDTVRDIYFTFKASAEKLKMAGYDLLEIGANGFDADYGAFKQSVKELERRLSAVIHLAFLDRTTPLAKFKLFESFDSLVKRPLIEDDLEQKYVTVVNETLATLTETRRIFALHKEKPPLENNLPPVAGSLFWAATLSGRMEAPMTKVRRENCGSFLCFVEGGEREREREVVLADCAVLPHLRFGRLLLQVISRCAALSR